MASARMNTCLAGRPHLFLSLLLLPHMFNYIDSTAGVSGNGNKVAIIGETVEIECSLGENSIDMMKWELIIGPKKVKVYIGKNPITDFAGRFSLSFDGLRSYNLIIRKIQKEDAGTYICRDRDEQLENYVNADLTILETPPICNSSNIARVSIAENSCGWPSDYLVLTCKVKYIGDEAPVLVWRDIDRKDVIRYANESGVVSSTIKIKSVWNRFTFSCQASQLPQNPCYIVIPKPFYAFSSSEERTVSYSQRVLCSANSSHACQYRWINDGEEVSTVQYLELESNSPPGDYQCVARCPFQEKYCEIPTLLIHYQASSCSQSWIVPVVGSVMATLIVVFAIFGISFTNPSSRFRRFVEWIGSEFQNRCLRNEKTKDPENMPFLSPPGERSEIKTNPEEMQLLSPHGERSEIKTTFEKLDSISGKGQIKGITVLNQFIYVVRYAKKEIERYSLDTTSAKSLDPIIPILILIRGLKEPRDLVSCSQTRALYISDIGNNVIHKHNIDNVKTDKWTKEITTAPEGLCVLPNTDVMVVFQREMVIKKFKSNGEFIVKYEVPNELFNPHHAIVLETSETFPNERYVLCYGEPHDKSNGICIVESGSEEIDESGKVVKKIKEIVKHVEVKQKTPQMWPTRLALMKNGNIIVVAYKWEKILLLDPKLNVLKVLLDLDKQQPTRMCFDEGKKRLYITENTDEGGILIYAMTDNND